jgi:hypothetical protein
VQSRSSFSSPSAAPPPRASYPHHEKHRKKQRLFTGFDVMSQFPLPKDTFAFAFSFCFIPTEIITLFKKNPVIPETNVEIRVFRFDSKSLP